MNLSIVTVMVGNFPRGEDYVQALYNGCKKWMGTEFDFYVITDRVELFSYPIHPVYQDRQVWGWWNLMEIYRPNAPWSESSLVMMGLDTVIRGPVDFLHQQMEPTFLMNFGDHYGYESAFNGVIADGAVFLPSWDHMNFLYHQYMEEVSEEFTYQKKRGFPMHLWVSDRIRKSCVADPPLWQEEWPGKICSYRMPQPKLEEPDEPLVIFHGSPRPHEAIEQAPWIKEYWKI